MLGKIKGAVEREDHFEVDDGSGRAFKVAKAGLSPRLVDRVREMYCGGRVQKMALGGEVLMPPGPASFREAYPGVLVSDPSSPFYRPPDVIAGIPSAPAPLEGVPESLARPLEVPPSLARPPEAPPEPLPAPPPPPPPAPIAGPSLPEDVAAPTEAAPMMPSAVGAMDEARAAGVEAARRIAEAGDLAKRSLDERAAAEAQARAAELSAAEGLVRAQDEATRRADEEAARLRDVYQRGENALRLQKEKLAAREKELLDPEAMRVETRRVFSRADPVGLMIGAMMVGAAEAATGKGSGAEAAMRVISDAIDRDVLAQKTEKGALQSARLRAYENAVGDVNNAAQLLKADQQLAASAAARLEAQRTQSAQGRLMLTQLSNQLSAQARKTAEDAVQLITGQALAQQKAASDAEGRQMALRQGEMALLRGSAELESAKRGEARADEQLELARARLGLDVRQQQLAEKAAEAKTGAVDYDVLGKMGYGLPADAFAQIKDEKASSSYIQTTDDKGQTVYRRARNPEAAEKVSKAQMAAELAKNQLERIEKYIPGPGKSVVSRLGFGEEARRADAEVKAATQALTTQLKEIEQLGALTGADLELVTPRIPSAQAWFTSDVAEQQQALDLRNSIDEMVQAISRVSVTAPPGGWPKKKGGR